MAHLLDETYGVEQGMGYIGELPWHRHGVVLTPGMSVDEAIEAVPAVNFQTETVDMFHSYGWQDSYKHERVEGFKAIIRSDTGATLGVATPRYKPIQIREQWKGLDPLINAGLASIETLGSLEGGKRVWGLVKLNTADVPEWDDLQEKVGEISPYALTMDIKTGKGVAIIAPTAIRVVCNNTLGAALGSLTDCVKVRHVGDTSAKMEEAAEELWGNMIASFKTLKESYTTLSNYHLSMYDFHKQVLDSASPIPTDATLFKNEARFDSAVSRAENKRAELTRLWTEGKGHTGNYTAWEALNGVIEALDHNEAGVFRKSRNDAEIASMLTGTKAQLKAVVTNNLLSLAA